jgi:hypothetical protein
VTSSQQLGIRLIKEGRVGIAYSESLDESALAAMLQDALDASRFAKVDPDQTIAVQQSRLTTDCAEINQPDTTPVEEKIALALRLESDMLALPDVVRCFLLDSEGRQIGRNLNSRQPLAAANPKFAPLVDTTGAVWSRRSYFQHAVDQPGVLYMSEPYLSMTDTRSCVTISMAIEIDEIMHVLCADVLISQH